MMWLKALTSMSNKKTKNLKGVFDSMNEAGKTGVAGEIQNVFQGFDLMSTIMKPLEPILQIFNSLIEVMGAGFAKALLPAIKPLIPLLTQMAPLFELLGWLIGWTTKIGLLPFVAAIYGVGWAIAWVVDFITAVLSVLTLGLIKGTNWVGAWNNIMLPILGGLIATGYQTGTDYVPATGLYALHQGEQVVTDEQRLADLKREYHLERQTAALEFLADQKKGRI